MPATNGFFFFSCSFFLASSLFFCHSFSCSMRRSRLSLSVGLAGRREENKTFPNHARSTTAQNYKTKLEDSFLSLLFFCAKITCFFLLNFRERYSPFRGEEVSPVALAFDVFLSRSFLPVSGALPRSLLVEDISFPVHGAYTRVL